MLKEQVGFATNVEQSRRSNRRVVFGAPLLAAGLSQLNLAWVCAPLNWRSFSLLSEICRPQPFIHSALLVFGETRNF
jgi:hypothetical protein